MNQQQPTAEADGDASELRRAFALVADFLGEVPLTERLALVERQLDGADRAQAMDVVGALGISPQLLPAAMSTRAALGRISDLIHALAILASFDGVLEPGERILRAPSLGPATSGERLYDLETDRRIAEFKMSSWDPVGSRNAVRKREVVKDLVLLAADTSGREAQLHVLGPEPIRYLSTSRSTLQAVLGSSHQAVLDRAAQVLGSQIAQMSVSAFRAGPAQAVRLIEIPRRASAA